MAAGQMKVCARDPVPRGCLGLYIDCLLPSSVASFLLAAMLQDYQDWFFCLLRLLLVSIVSLQHLAHGIADMPIV